MTQPGRKALRLLAHAAALAGLYLAFSGALFLGLQVDPTFGALGLAAAAALAVLYVRFAFFRK